MIIYKESKIRQNNTTYYISLINKEKHLCISGSHDGFEGHYLDEVFIAPLTTKNAKRVRKLFPWLNPRPLLVNASFGFGDRLGYATCGHIEAIKDTNIYPVFAQQSVRENQRTNRTPQDVIDDAMWQIFQSGYKGVWGADADHVKEIKDVKAFIKAGYTFYTIDPNEYVDNNTDIYTLEQLRKKAQQINNIDIKELTKIYLTQPNKLDIIVNEEIFLKAVVKYSKAIMHVEKVAKYISSKLDKYDLEMSVDETDTPTSIFEHYFIAKELRRLEIPFVSLALRFIGSFEKGVDYIGDINVFKDELKEHVRIMNYIGGYKLSIHTGSDKFSIYKELSLKTNNKIHVKTAGTSYLEALRVIATVDPKFFKEIFKYCKSCYEHDKKTYHVSAKLSKVPEINVLNEDTITTLFNHFDARQVMHVTFGSVLDKYKQNFNLILLNNIKVYNKYLVKHFKKHLEHFIQE